MQDKRPPTSNVKWGKGGRQGNLRKREALRALEFASASLPIFDVLGVVLSDRTC